MLCEIGLWTTTYCAVKKNFFALYCDLKALDIAMEKLGQILENSLNRLHLGGKLTDYRVWPLWNETVGPTIARNAQPEKIRHGTLFVKVSSPVWMQQLQYMKEMIAEKLNQRVGEEVVKNIFFVVGTIKTSETQPPPKVSESPPPPPHELTPPADQLASVRDPETRDLLARLYAAHARRHKG